ncbi:MAG: hypothetical protein NTW86_10725 [Candidatus Sumerlaeota bacterium]|nr:hypothetical protein [Candidatus Sumerlaeota bacterium]
MSARAFWRFFHVRAQDQITIGESGDGQHKQAGIPEARGAGGRGLAGYYDGSPAIRELGIFSQAPSASKPATPEAAGKQARPARAAKKGK